MVKMMIKNTPVMFALPPTSPNIPGFDVSIQSKILHLLHSSALFKALESDTKINCLEGLKNKFLVSPPGWGY